MARFIKTGKNSHSASEIPNELPILPVRNMVPFPLATFPLEIGMPRSVRLVEDALKGNKMVGLVAIKDSSIEEPGPGEVYETGTVAIILRAQRTQDGNIQAVVQCLERFRVSFWLGSDPYLRAQIELSPEMIEATIEVDALKRNLREAAQEIIVLSPNIPNEAVQFLNQVEDPRILVYLIAANANLTTEIGQKVLEENDFRNKMQLLIAHLNREKEVLSLGQKIKTDAMEEMNKAQREYFLRQQLKAIQKELGDIDENQSIATEYTEKIEKTGLPEEAKKEALREMKRLEGMPPQSAEYSVIKTYLDWLVELPWNTMSEDVLDINNARKVLDEDHYDLFEVKERIIEYLAVRKLKKERGVDNKSSSPDPEKAGMGVILCFVGPPGVGKTSLGQSIARSLGRAFTRMSLGGMRDEAEIRGHRRTYIGAMPGRIIQAIKRAGTRNPVFMLDEVDKIGADWRGDPSSALLEVLDPAQNHAFRDHYLDVDFDLSDVIFITTANQLETIPSPLRDRMEIITIDGYTEHEKVHIAEEHLISRQLTMNGLLKGEVVFTDTALQKIIRDYTREAGVRNLERQIGAICRKIVTRIAAGEKNRIEITPEDVRTYLKREKFESESSEKIEIPGIATGLAVTAVGGDILFIEATKMKGKGNLKLTGQLGDVMRESAEIAFSYVRSNASAMGIDPGKFENHDVHLHVPAGAIPKDGPSAGLAMVMAIASLFSGRAIKSSFGMTGEATLRGRVLPVGGIKMKVLAAHRAGLSTVILPKRNEGDLEELPEEVRREIEFILAERIEDALHILFPTSESPRENPIRGERKKNNGDMSVPLELRSTPGE